LACAADRRWSWWLLVILSVLSLWYLPVGTGLALLQLVLLVVARLRTPARVIGAPASTGDGSRPRI